MALKRKIDKATWEKLSDEMKPLYTDKDGAYVLDIETGDDDAGELRRANDRLKQEAKDAKAEAKRLKEQLEEGGELDAKKRGDIETLEKSWKEKNEALKADYETKLSNKDKYIRDNMLDSAAKDLATIAKSPAIIMPHIKQRLDVDLSGDVPTIRVLDKNGKPSAQSLEDLRKEFVANKDFSDIIVASKASGGAAKTNEGKGGGSALGTPQNDSKPLSALSAKDLAATLKARKESSSAE